MLQCDCVLLLLCGDVIDLGGYICIFQPRMYTGVKKKQKKDSEKENFFNNCLIVLCQKLKWNIIKNSLLVAQTARRKPVNLLSHPFIIYIFMLVPERVNVM